MALKGYIGWTYWNNHGAWGHLCHGNNSTECAHWTEGSLGTHKQYTLGLGLGPLLSRSHSAVVVATSTLTGKALVIDPFITSVYGQQLQGYCCSLLTPAVGIFRLEKTTTVWVPMRYCLFNSPIISTWPMFLQFLDKETKNLRGKLLTATKLMSRRTSISVQICLTPQPVLFSWFLVISQLHGINDSWEGVWVYLEASVSQLLLPLWSWFFLQIWNIHSNITGLYLLLSTGSYNLL